MTIFTFRNPQTQKVVNLSLPLALTQVITIGSIFLCMTLLASFGKEVLAACALISTVSFTVLIICASILFSLSILISHAYGKQDYDNIGCLLQQGWILAGILSVPAIIVFWNIHPILVFLGQEERLAVIVEEFFHANIWRVLPFLLSICHQQLCYGVHKQKIDMLANMLGVVVLLVSANILIFGWLGFPALGVAGFGYASALQSCFYLLFTSYCFYRLEDFKKFDLFRIRIHQHWYTLIDIFKIGWPISLQISGEMLAFLVFTTFVGWLGVNALAAYQMIMQYQFLIMVPVFAISQSSGILLGQAYGSKQFTELKAVGHASLAIATAVSTVTGLLFIFFPKLLASIYIDVYDPANAQVVEYAIILFAIMAIAQFGDSIRNVLIGSLRGLLDTRTPMLVGLLSIWLVGVPLAYLFAFSLEWGPVGVVLGGMMGMVIGAALLYYRWRVMTAKLFDMGA